MAPRWWEVASAWLLLALLAFLVARRLYRRATALRSRRADAAPGLTLAVTGMSCQHCVGRVKQILEDFEQVEQAEPDLASGLVRVQGTGLDRQTLAAAITRAGYGVVGTD